MKSLPRSKFDACSRSFTLIELLVVVAIIAILAAILLPSLQKSRQQAKRVTCMTHLKQVAVATLLMADEHDGWINGTGKSDLNPTNSQYWIYTVTNYLGSPKLVEACVPPHGRSAACPDLSYGLWGAGAPYGANTAFVYDLYDPSFFPMYPLTVVKHSSTTFLVAESYYWYPHFNDAFTWTCEGVYYGLDPDAIYLRHNAEGLNFVFVDGHGEFMKDHTWGPSSGWGVIHEWGGNAPVGFPYNIWGP